MLAVETKKKFNPSRDWAIQLRYNLLSRGVYPSTHFLLITLPEIFYLWAIPEPFAREQGPSFIIDARPILKPYFDKVQVTPTALSGSSFELIIGLWLNDLLDSDLAVDKIDKQLTWLIQSGLYQAIHGGHVEHEDFVVNVYAESNYVLELAFQQEQSDDCEQILLLAEARSIHLLLPAYCFAESHEKLARQRSNRKALLKDLESEMRQLRKTSTYTSHIASLQDISILLIRSNENEKANFAHYRTRLLQACALIPLTRDIISSAAGYESTLNFEPPDAIVFASVIDHLQGQGGQPSCFINKNRKDFDNPDVKSELSKFNCRMITNFGDGLRFLKSHLTPK